MARGGEQIIKVNAPVKKDVIFIRILISLALLSMAVFAGWFFRPDHVGFGPLYMLLTFALVFKLVKMLHEWYHYWSPSVPVTPVSSKKWKVDVLTTACPGEPREMIVRTLRAMVAITYPHTNYLCDEGNDPELKRICEELGVRHVTRTEKKDAKAGNINNALRVADGDICVVLDPDHEPVPQFLDRVLPYFEDEKIGFVQCVQGYSNQDQSFIARGAAEQTYHFYGPMMMCMNTYGTVQAIGANCTFRRSALDSIGGHAAGLSEDMHTAMQLHAKGWKSVYIPEMLTKGLVPATLSSYYKQQLKWSRGTFDLLFHTYPKLYRHFTWRQRLHYFTIPLYFLFGLINLLDIAVPLLALSLAHVPWELPLDRFALCFLPLCALSMIIRLYAQRWLLEDHERGFHLTGGIVRLATWWIFLVGFVYTILKIRVPYIPTPKEDEHQNYVRLNIPNFIVIIVGACGVLYGLSIDWTPYSIAMASYVFMTAAMLAVTIVLSQQKFIADAASFFSRLRVVRPVMYAATAISTRTQQAAYRFLQNGPLMLLSAASLVLLSYNSLDEPGEEAQPKEKLLGGFYLGNDGNKPLFRGNIVSFTNTFASETMLPDSAALWKVRDSQIPFIRWTLQDPTSDQHSIVEGGYDELLKKAAITFRRYQDPVLISLNDDAVDSEQFRLAWQYLFTFFNELGINNLTWVWCPKNSSATDRYPGEKFVDWIGVSCLNYGADRTADDWYSFSQLYEPYRKSMGPYAKPVLLTGLGCATGQNQRAWLAEASNDIINRYREIHAAIMHTGKLNIHAPDPGGPLTMIDFSLAEATPINDLITGRDDAENNPAFSAPATPSLPTISYRSRFVRGGPGAFTLTIGKQPVYIKGVAYNTAHDWRDGHMPLTRRQVENDLSLIKAMGANTVRRYGTGIYDQNVLNIAAETDIKVLYGFWFDPKIDYHADHEKVDEYSEDVLAIVQKYKDHPAVLAWSIGNEAWGLLKHTYAKPYLIKVRLAYVRMIEQLARRIHQIDPTRPVITCLEHEEYQLPGELAAFRDIAPSIDVIGVNSYYKQQISTLNHVMWQFDSLRPYIVSEFGPFGYWDPKYNVTSGGSLREQTDSEKAQWYSFQWKHYVQAYKGYNAGGFAYCWHDRMEGSITWFGITDMRGRLKPSYYALRETWTGKSAPLTPPVRLVIPDNLSPGATYNIFATNVPPGARCEWRLLKDEYLDEVDNIVAGEGEREAVLTVPREPSLYRLYLSVIQADGRRATTASAPIQVKNESL